MRIIDPRFAKVATFSIFIDFSILNMKNHHNSVSNRKPTPKLTQKQDLSPFRPFSAKKSNDAKYPRFVYELAFWNE